MNLSIIIPQMFYDIIGRVIPGLVVLALAYASWPGTKFDWVRARALAGWLSSAELSPAFAIVSFSMMAYVLATVLGGLWTLWGTLTGKTDSRSHPGDMETTGTGNGTVENAGQVLSSTVPSRQSFIAELGTLLQSLRRAPLSKASLHDALAGVRFIWYQLFGLCPSYDTVTPRVVSEWGVLYPGSPTVALNAWALMYDEIRIIAPETGARIAKLRAEAHGYRSIVLGGWFCFVLNGSNLFRTSAGGAWAVELILFLSLLGMSAAYRWRQEQWCWSLCNQWLLLHVARIHMKPTVTNLVEVQHGGGKSGDAAVGGQAVASHDPPPTPPL